jgi:voltage-gated potassium channel Kch
MGRAKLRPPLESDRQPSDQHAGGGRTGTGDRELDAVTDKATPERRLDRVLARATRPRGAAVVIATVSTSITVGAGILMTVADHNTFPSIGSGLWWAVQTVTTVGYGDHVPANVAGRLVASLVMLVGIGFLTVITAAITGTFVSRSRREHTPSAGATSTAEQLQQISGRLERIEDALTGRR